MRPPPNVDALTIGRRIRRRRLERGLTLEQLGAAIGRAASQVSVIENGHREPKLSQLAAIAGALDTSVEELLVPQPPSRRDALEIGLERIQRGPVFEALRIKPIRVGRTLPTEALEAILALHRELERLHTERAATPEEARRANSELRTTMRAQNNYFPELEATARRLLASVEHEHGPLSHQVASDLAAHLGFELLYLHDLPHSTRSVVDLRNRRLYLPATGSRVAGDPRSTLLQALASHVLDHSEPRDYAEFLRQRVESNYLSAALLLPEQDAVAHLAEAKDRHDLSIDDLRDAYAVSYETAAHRFTNLATRHLDIPVHFMKVHESGIIHKAYENDGVQFPMDPLGAVEGQYSCRQWTARTIFEAPSRDTLAQYTDTPAGTYWCTSHLQDTADGKFSVSVGVPFGHVRWFRGRDTTSRRTSRCPDESCCRRPPAELAKRWEGLAWPSAKPHASMLAAMPAGAFPGVDTTEVYQFLDRHAPD